LKAAKVDFSLYQSTRSSRYDAFQSLGAGMRRREFIGLVGGAVAGWPLATRAQPPNPVVGFLRSTSLADSPHLLVAFRQGLQETGVVDGQNAEIAIRSADNQHDRLPALIADLVSRSAAVIVANSIAAPMVKAATTTIPLVFTTGSDPVRDGLVPSLSRPNGNVTGVVFITGELGAKRLVLLRQLVPQASTIAAFVYPGTPETEAERQDLQTAAKAVGQQLVVLDVASEHDIETAFASLAQRGIGAVLLGSGSFLFSKRELPVALAARYAIPAMHATRDSVVAGGLMSYGTSITEAYRQAGIYAGRIVKGEKPSDLPVIQSAKFEFVINLKVAKTLGLEFHPQLLATADEVIE
jgi:putative ABC transport system substrate-binding protein